ncbi:hypothetical protein EMCRGX_G034838 [Ephydatia muelleri]|eukprot:Em0023g746a
MADRPKGYGMTAEIQERLDAKYDAGLEAQAREWMELVVEEPFPEGSFQEALKDGTYLCKLMNKLEPGAIRKINESKMAFKMMENIGLFLDACCAYGLTKVDLFQTVDLYDGTNIPQVINGIHALGRKAQVKGFSGAVLGPKEAAADKKEWTDEQLKAGQNIIGLQMGSNKGASAAGTTPFGLGRQIEKTNLKV